MVALHLFGIVVNLLLNLIGALKGLQIEFVIGLHGFLVQCENQLFHFQDFRNSLLRECGILLLEGFGILDDVFRIVADAFKVADRADGRRKITLVEIVEPHTR